ncbi:ASPARTIC PROTEASE IN GUARD CELL 1 protein [Nymphaea thermarum]|nr:ASPARTIC PROTEASE IN GUARD CELL 1 protein [Nymphaea thermarum]
MGRHAAFSLLSSLAILLSLSAFCFSRELKHGHGKTATLDVAASLSAAHQLLSRSPQVLQDSLSLATTASSDGTTSFELRARDTLKPSGHKDYKNLTLARLRRDAARVEALNSRLALRLQGVSKADLKPLIVSYGDGSYTVGDFATETMTFGPSASVDRIAVGCGHDNEGLFVGAGGLLGLGGGSLSFPSQLSTSAFSYCLVDRDSSAAGTLTFGPAAAEGADLVRAPLLRNKRMDTFYYVGLSGISVGGSPLSIPPSVFQMDESGNGGVILDSGTAITRLPPSAYASLRDAFAAATPSLPRAPSVSLFDTCYDLSSRTSVDVATIALHFGSGESLQLPAKNYLVPVDSAGTFCFAFAPTTSSVSIIGNVQQQGIKVSFDSANSQVGFAPNKC